uniref:EGF-like domain-containing protein n=1 Tax=Wuchereria bancrofti TaxID=6293 RepID=A0AAF5PLF0_WUCBA
MMNGHFSLKLSFVLLLTLRNLTSIEHRKEKAFLSDFNQTLLKNYARYPSTTHSNFIYSFSCIDSIWNDIKKRNVFFLHPKSESSPLVYHEIFDYDFSAIYLLCWVTMNSISILKKLPYCNVQQIVTSVVKITENEGANEKEEYIWRPSQALARNFTFNQTTHITLGSFDMKLFRCAKSSFCVNGCNPSPCLGNGTCVLKSSYNEDFAGMYRNLWNVSCDCAEFDVNKRVDINKWLYMNCVQTHGENWESVNLKGSYSCVCKLGFNPVNNGPTLAEAIKFPLKKIVLIVCLLLSAW